jgi:hypothetical protein
MESSPPPNMYFAVFYVKSIAGLKIVVILHVKSKSLFVNCAFFFFHFYFNFKPKNRGIMGSEASYTASPTKTSTSPSSGVPCSHQRGSDDRFTAV